MSKKDAIKLNAAQLKAVNHDLGPLLVIAGAGTGKTSVITERIKHLIKKKNVNPQDILAVTFTEKASQEMVARLDQVMPLGYQEPWVYTFHSFADRLLRNEGLEIGLNSSYKIMSYPEQWLLLRKHIFDMKLDYFRPLGNPTKFISALLKFISRLQDEYIMPSDLDAFAKSFNGDPTEKKRWIELASIYKHYESFKQEESKLDFGDLIVWVIKLFELRPNILKKYQKQFKHMLVDEFQDTNFAQYLLIKTLFPHTTTERSLLVVGDDSQSIYKFRGAAVSNILEFQKDYPTAEMLTLTLNYRSTQEILDPSYALVQNNNPDTLESKLGISKKLISANGLHGQKPYICQAQTLEEEVEFTVLEIIELLGRDPHYTYKDIAILARANSHLDPFIFALRKYGLPYQLVGNRGLYDRDEVRDILALLRCIVNPLDSIALYRVLNISVFDIKKDTIAKVLADAKFKKLDMWEILNSSTDETLSAFVALLKGYQEVITEKAPTELMYELVNRVGYIQQFAKEETVENQLRINNLNLLLDKVKKFEVSHKQDTRELPTIVDFIDYIDLMIEAGENPAQAEIEDIDTINLLTVHASKGLEFPVVFMVNLVADRFPTRDRKDLIDIPDELIKETLPDGDPHIQEERRLFYVGMTRAQKYLYLLTAKNYGGKRDKNPSGFLFETGLEVESMPIRVTATQESLFGVNTTFRNGSLNKIVPHIPYSLSYSKLEDFLTCPLKYKYKYVLNIPTPPSHALSFGISIHDTLRDYYAKKVAGEAVSLDDLTTLFKQHWQPLGYMSKQHQQVRFDSGTKLLSDYYVKTAAETSLPVGLEKSFALKIGGIKFYGRIDRIDPLADGSVEIIDYKTGTTKTQKEVDADNQVSLYAIAAKKALGLNPTKFSYYFLEEGVKISTERSTQSLIDKEAEIAQTVEELKKGEFNATPGMHCTWCDFKDICPYAYKG